MAHVLRLLAAGLAALVLFTSAAAHAQPARVALVIGNSKYASAPLTNPANDARAMAAKLRGLGFTVIERVELRSREIPSTLREFRSTL
ncbi:MAG TPA: caspase family protein, partial [Usitatibacter sp.]|nr:caspase family protein [Usitatibacter sp.]